MGDVARKANKQSPKLYIFRRMGVFYDYYYYYYCCLLYMLYKRFDWRFSGFDNLFGMGCLMPFYKFSGCAFIDLAQFIIIFFLI